MFDFLEVSMSSHTMDRLYLAIRILKLRVEIHTYFDDIKSRDECKVLLNQYVKEHMLEKQRGSHQAAIHVLEHPRITPAPDKMNTTVSANNTVSLSLLMPCSDNSYRCPGYTNRDA